MFSPSTVMQVINLHFYQKLVQCNHQGAERLLVLFTRIIFHVHKISVRTDFPTWPMCYHYICVPNSCGEGNLQITRFNPVFSYNVFLDTAPNLNPFSALVAHLTWIQSTDLLVMFLSNLNRGIQPLILCLIYTQNSDMKCIQNVKHSNRTILLIKTCIQDLLKRQLKG